MEKKLRAGICGVITVITFLVFNQDLTTSFLVSLSMYFFLESYYLKAASNAHLFIRKEPPCEEERILERNEEKKVDSKKTDVETSDFSINTNLNPESDLKSFPADSLKVPQAEVKVSSTMTETLENPKIDQKAEDTQTEPKQYSEASTSNHIEQKDDFTSISLKFQDFSCLVETPEKKSYFTLSSQGFISISGKVIKKRPALIQTENFLKFSETQTETKTFKDVEVQVWVMQDEQEVNTTQSLARTFQESRPRSESVEVIHEDYYQKELLISELLFERVTSKTGNVNYLFKTHLETELNVLKPFQYPPYCISLLDWTQSDLTQMNYDLLKERFQNSERVVKIRTNEFKPVEVNSFIDDSDFQSLFFGVFTNLLSHSSIYLIDSSKLSESFITSLKLKWKVLKDFSPIFFLHLTTSLENSAQNLSQRFSEEFGMKSELTHAKIAFFDNSFKVFHLEAGKSASFNFIEEKILSFEFFNNFIRDEFDFAEYCKEHLKKCLKLILKTETQGKISSSSQVEDYGFQISTKYKNFSTVPTSLIEKELKSPNLLKVSSISRKNLIIESIFQFTPSLPSLSTRPLSFIFLSLPEQTISDLFLPSHFNSQILEVSSKISPSGIQDELFSQLSSWVLGSFLSDFLILIIDFCKMPDLHHSDLILKFLSALKDSEKPIHILHKTSDSISYTQSLSRITELVTAVLPSDRAIFHEEITDNRSKNSEVLENIKDQMNDNLFDPDSSWDLKETCKSAFENTVEMLMLIQNTRKRELLTKAELELHEDAFVAKCELEPTWKAEVRAGFQQFPLKNIVYVSPAQYHIDQNISATVYSTLVQDFQDHLVKIAVFSNLPAEKLSHLYLAELGFCFAQNKEDTLLVFPSSRVVMTSASNHLNTQEFNSIFLHKFIEKIADCLIVSLFYRQGKALEPFDGFAGISAALGGRKASKPIMILHHFDGVGEMNDYSLFFHQAIKDFDKKISEWTGLAALNDVQIKESMNEGLYAFDVSKQVIHRLVVSSSEEIWKWYNGVLYKIMHNAALKTQIKPLVPATQEAFASTLKETVLIFEDENVVDPDIQVSNYLEMSWKAIHSFSFKVFADILPLWTITSRV
jgi:hypothetical protein